MSNPVVWVTGAGGFIGCTLVRAARNFAPDWQVVALTRERLDLLNFDAVTSAFHAQPPALVLHCAGLAWSAACQADPGRATALNVDTTRHLCALARNIPFFFFSTDLVFDGRKGHYVETDPIHPGSVYGETKAEAERLVLENPGHTVLRLSLNAGVSPSGDRSFTEQMRRAWERGETLNLFRDEYRSPLPAIVTARAVWELARLNQPGLYHLAGSERLSRWEIGQLFARRWPQAIARITAGSVKDFPGSPRPPDTSLDCAKIAARLSFPLPGLTKWLAENP